MSKPIVKPAWGTCPCCNVSVALEHQKNLLLLSSTGKVWPAVAEMAAETEMVFYHRNKQYRRWLYWACNQCITKQKALVADLSKQRYGWRCEPYLAYFDETRTCVDCGVSFVFTKEDQRHWYETLRFWVWSRPVRCKTCNNVRKQRVIGHKEDRCSD